MGKQWKQWQTLFLGSKITADGDCSHEIKTFSNYIYAGLEEAQAGIKVAGRNINNLRYTDDITLMAESKDECKGPLDKGERGE